MNKQQKNQRRARETANLPLLGAQSIPCTLGDGRKPQAERVAELLTNTGKFKWECAWPDLSLRRLTSGLSTSHSNKTQQQHSINQLNKERALTPGGALQTDSTSKLKGWLETPPPPRALCSANTLQFSFFPESILAPIQIG